MGSSWQNFSNPIPPERGSFPLDFNGTCNQEVKEYLQCLRANKNQYQACIELSKKYLKCRMNNGLMEKEDFISLGFKEK
jgi:cytochrome c oxidase assembly protein subunit 19